jgi:hypothetical protein
MRFVLGILLAALLPASLPGSASAAERSMTTAQAHAAAAKGDQKAAAAVGMTTDRQTCLGGCANRGYDKSRCASACRPGVCHPDGDTPYCVGEQ